MTEFDPEKTTRIYQTTVGTPAEADDPRAVESVTVSLATVSGEAHFTLSPDEARAWAADLVKAADNVEAPR